MDGLLGAGGRSPALRIPRREPACDRRQYGLDVIRLEGRGTPVRTPREVRVRRGKTLADGGVALDIMDAPRAVAEKPWKRPFSSRFRMASTPSAQFSLTLRVELKRTPGTLGRLTSAIGEAGGSIGAVDIIEQRVTTTLREITVDATDQEHWERIVKAVEELDGVRFMESTDRTFEIHRGGKIYTGLKTGIKSRDDLSMAYTPGVARVSVQISEDPVKSHEYTIRRNTVAVVSDGTAVLGLGDIGPEAALPVMEGKAVLFKEFAEVDAFPIVLDTKDPDEIVQVVKLIAPTFGGVNLEDISSPRCFEIENRLVDELDIPVFHDDQHGTAIVVLAALHNACRLTGRQIEDLKAVMVGAGAAGVAVAKILMHSGVTSIIACDRFGAIHDERDDYAEGRMNEPKRWLADHTNATGRAGTPAEVLEGSDLFIGLSGPGIITAKDLERMNPDPFVFAMANPTPEVSPEEAAPHVRVMATGRSDYPNQINNVLAFPGIFRGALDVRAPKITEEMKIAAARGIAEVVSDEELSEDYIVPSVFNREVSPCVARAVAEEAERSGIARGAAALAPIA
jgi:malate dehydrogenase (oxaloacetate-decarboxylating)